LTSQRLCDTVALLCRSLDALDTNYLGKENSDLLSACVLNFAAEGVGRRVSQMCVDEILTDFSGDWWNHNGPDLVTKVLKKICGIDKVSTTALAAKRSLSRAESFITTDSPSASLFWNKVPVWGLRPDFYYCQTVTVC
jgi:hypothetical protein